MGREPAALERRLLCKHAGRARAPAAAVDVWTIRGAMPDGERPSMS